MLGTRHIMKLACLPTNKTQLWTGLVSLQRMFHVPPGDSSVGDVDLSPSDIEYYRQNGFIKVPQLLGKGQLERWRSTVDSAVEERGDQRFPQGDDYSAVQDDAYTKVFDQRVNLWKSHTDAAKLLSSAKQIIGRMACYLEGVNGVRVWHDQALYKPPFSNPTTWHAAARQYPFTSSHALSIWIALDDTTTINGCMYLLPGSHHLMQAITERNNRGKNVPVNNDMDIIFREYPELLQSQVEPIPLEMKAGDCTFYNGSLITAAGPNMTAKYCRAMTIQIMPVGMTFNGKRSILTQEEFDILKIGDTMDDDAQYPLLYTMHDC